MDAKKEKELIKEYQDFKNSIGIQIVFPSEIKEQIYALEDRNELYTDLQKFGIIGLADPTRYNVYDGYCIDTCERCLFRAYQPHDWPYFCNEMATYDKLADSYYSCYINFQRKKYVIFSEQSQTAMICLNYHYLISFSDFQFSLNILPMEAKLKIILKIAISLLHSLRNLHNFFRLAHHNISPTSIIFSLDFPPMLTDFSHTKEIVNLDNEEIVKPLIESKINENSTKSVDECIKEIEAQNRDLIYEDFYNVGCIIHSLFTNTSFESKKSFIEDEYEFIEYSSDDGQTGSEIEEDEEMLDEKERKEEEIEIKEALFDFSKKIELDNGKSTRKKKKINKTDRTDDEKEIVNIINTLLNPEPSIQDTFINIIDPFTDLIEF